MIPIKRLYDLQELDWEIAACEKSLAEVRARLADDSALTSARAQVAQLDSRLAERALVRRQAELATRELDERLQAAEKRLYGGFITSQRELSAFEEERSFHQRQRSAEEDRLLDLMVEIEDLESAHDGAYQHLVRVEAARSAELVELLETEERLTGELGQMQPARGQMISQVPPATLSLYESLRKERNGHAVAKVERGMCQGCRVALPVVELQRARSSQSPVQCNSCRRILYVG